MKPNGTMTSGMGVDLSRLSWSRPVKNPRLAATKHRFCLAKHHFSVRGFSAEVTPSNFFWKLAFRRDETPPFTRMCKCNGPVDRGKTTGGL